jgi:hypothetical protein
MLDIEAARPPREQHNWSSRIAPVAITVGASRLTATTRQEEHFDW